MEKYFKIFYFKYYQLAVFNPGTTIAKILEKSFGAQL